eukprot:4356140-Pyramimonas_sp.AAC.1
MGTPSVFAGPLRPYHAAMALDEGHWITSADRKSFIHHSLVRFVTSSDYTDAVYVFPRRPNAMS